MPGGFSAGYSLGYGPSTAGGSTSGGSTSGGSTSGGSTSAPSSSPFPFPSPFLPTIGPIDVRQGQNVLFTVDFLSASGAIANQTSANMNLVYTSVAGSTIQVVLPMTFLGATFVANWGSSVAALGFVQCQATTGLGLINPSALLLRVRL